MACRRSPRLHPQIHASEEAGAGPTRRRRRRRTSPPAPLPDDDDMLREILLRLPPHPSSLPRAAAVTGHGSCHSSPFKVVLMYENATYNQPLARVYSSETGVWGDPILSEAHCEISRKPAVLVGNCLYWLSMGDAILEFDLGEQSLTAIKIGRAHV